MEDGLVFNAMDGAKKLGISPDELGKKYDALKKGVPWLPWLQSAAFGAL